MEISKNFIQLLCKLSKIFYVESEDYHILLMQTQFASTRMKHIFKCLKSTQGER